MSDLKSLAERAIQLAEKATPGEWFLNHGTIRSSRPPSFGIPVLDEHFKDHDPWCAFVGEDKTANGELIAFSRTALPELAQGYLELREAAANLLEHGIVPGTVYSDILAAKISSTATGEK